MAGHHVEAHPGLCHWQQISCRESLGRDRPGLGSLFTNEPSGPVGQVFASDLRLLIGGTVNTEQLGANKNKECPDKTTSQEWSCHLFGLAGV